MKPDWHAFKQLKPTRADFPIVAILESGKRCVFKSAAFDAICKIWYWQRLRDKPATQPKAKPPVEPATFRFAFDGSQRANTPNRQVKIRITVM